MKFTNKILVSLLLVMGTAPWVSGRQNDWANFERYAKSNQEIISSADTGRRVVFSAIQLQTTGPRCDLSFSSPTVS